MTTTPIARILDTARITCPGSLDGMIRLEFFNVLKEFFQRSDCWLFELPVYIAPLINDYVVDTCQNVVVNRLMGLGMPPAPAISAPIYAPMCPPQFLQVVENQVGQETQNPLYRVPREGMLLDAGTKNPVLRLRINPQTNEIWIATLALNITDPTDRDGLPEPPDWIMEKYSNYISSGVISRLMLQPGKPYSSQSGAAYHGRKFNEGVGIARNDVRHMFSYGAQRWAFPRGWGVTHPSMPSGQLNW